MRDMPRVTPQEKQQRVLRIIAALDVAYPAAHCELTHSNPLELLVATILSAQCSDRQVNLVTPDLFKKYPAAADFAAARPAQLEAAIRRIGLYRNKAKNIQAASRVLVQKHGGQVPRTMEELLELPGVGRKTANVVLGNAFGVSVGIVVDTHVARLSGRLRLTRHTAPEKIETDLQRWVPPGRWMDFSHLLIWHGRRCCFARNPECVRCQILADCPTGRAILNKARGMNSR
jgi:endonuclease-3